MNRILIAVIALCSIAVSSFAQQHNKGVSGLSISGIGLYTSRPSFGGEVMYSRYMTRRITLQGGLFFDRSAFSTLDKKIYPIDSYGVRADAYYLVARAKSIYLNVGGGIGVGFEDVSLAKKQLQERHIMIEGLSNRLSLGIEAKLQAEYFVFPELALIFEGKGIYRPLANTHKMIPAIGVGIKKLF